MIYVPTVELNLQLVPR